LARFFVVLATLRVAFFAAFFFAVFFFALDLRAVGLRAVAFFAADFFATLRVELTLPRFTDVTLRLGRARAAASWKSSSSWSND
jgi:hypothetical protein